MSPSLARALQRNREVVITTYDAAGRPGGAPVWFVHLDGRVYIATGRESRKTRKLRADPRVRLRFGRRQPVEAGGRGRVCEDRETVGRAAPVLNARYDGAWGPDADMVERCLSGEYALLEIALEGTDAAPRTVKRSAAVAVTSPRHPGQVVLVLRPVDPSDPLAGAWGLPAASQRPGESLEDTARRAVREKLGLDPRALPPATTGRQPRGGHDLEMTLFTAETGSDPVLPMPRDDGSTWYAAWRWGSAEDLRPAAERGSLCSALYLEWQGGVR